MLPDIATGSIGNEHLLQDLRILAFNYSEVLDNPVF